MSFPTNSTLLDDFTGSGTSPNWSVITGGTGFVVITLSGGLGTDASSTKFAFDYYNQATFGPDCEAFMTIAAVGTDLVRIGGRVQSPGTTGYDGYFIQVSATGGWSIIRIDNNTATTLATGVTQHLTAGDQIGISIIGTVVTGWYNNGSGWVSKISYDTSGDATQYTTAGSLAVEFKSSTIDDFSGGTAASGTTFTATLTASSSTASTLQRAAAALRSASSSQIASMVRSVATSRALAVSQSPTVQRLVSAVRSLAQTQAAVVAAVRTKLQAVSTTQAQAAALSRSSSRGLSAPQGSGASIKRTVSRSLSVAQVSSATLRKLVSRALSAAQTQVTSIAKSLVSGTPVFVAAGTAAAGSGTSLAPGYPASIAAGDLLVLQSDARSNTHASQPAGWTSQGRVLGSPIEQEYFTKIADGTETGTLTVNYDLSAWHQARIYAFRGGTNLEALTSATDNNVTVAQPSETTLGSDRLVVALIDIAQTVAVGAFTGESGGTWVEPVAEQSSTDTLQIQTADMAAAGTISGGTISLGAPSAWVVQVFAIYKSGPQTFTKTLAAAATPAATVKRLISRALSATQAQFSGVLPTRVSLKGLTASQGQTPRMNRGLGRRLTTAQSQSASFSSHFAVVRLLTVAVNVASLPVMWFRIGYRIAAAAITALPFSPASKGSLSVTPESPASLTAEGATPTDSTMNPDEN